MITRPHVNDLHSVRFHSVKILPLLGSIEGTLLIPTYDLSAITNHVILNRGASSRLFFRRPLGRSGFLNPRSAARSRDTPSSPLLLCRAISLAAVFGYHGTDTAAHARLGTTHTQILPPPAKHSLYFFAAHAQSSQHPTPTSHYHLFLFFVTRPKKRMSANDQPKEYGGQRSHKMR